MLLSSAMCFLVRKFLGTNLVVVLLIFIILQDRILVCVCVFFFFSVAQQPYSGLDRLVLEASISHQLDIPPVGLL